jgi:GTPase SAR1 family protein
MELVHSPGFKGTRQNGRTPGSVNRTTKEVRELFKELLESNFETIEQDLQQLEPKDRINIILQLAKFVIPTLRAVEVKEDLNDNFTPIIFEFSE